MTVQWSRDGYMPNDPPCPICGSEPCQHPCVISDAELELVAADMAERDLRDALLGYDPRDALVGWERVAAGE